MAAASLSRMYQESSREEYLDYLWVLSGGKKGERRAYCRTEFNVFKICDWTPNVYEAYFRLKVVDVMVKDKVWCSRIPKDYYDPYKDTIRLDNMILCQRVTRLLWAADILKRTKMDSFTMILSCFVSATKGGIALLTIMHEMNDSFYENMHKSVYTLLFLATVGTFSDILVSVISQNPVRLLFALEDSKSGLGAWDELWRGYI